MRLFQRRKSLENSVPLTPSELQRATGWVRRQHNYALSVDHYPAVEKESIRLALAALEFVALNPELLEKESADHDEAK